LSRRSTNVHVVTLLKQQQIVTLNNDTMTYSLRHPF
jgi:hypothetical protein